MTKTINSFGQLAELLVVDKLKAIVAAETAMESAAKIVQHDAKERIGEYQEAVGPFDAWDPLADSTEFDKARKGYPALAPLLREGDLRESIVTEHNALEAVIGSKEPVARYQEFGTERIPPRPFIGPAGYSNHAKIGKIICGSVAAALGNSDIYQAEINALKKI